MSAAERGVDEERPVWRVELVVPSVGHAEAFESALATLGGAVTFMEVGGGRGTGAWRLIGYSAAAPDEADITARIAVCAAVAGIEPPEFHVERMADTDWVAEAARNSLPVHAGRFFVYRSHHTAPPPADKTAIQLDASRAFGSGEHASTSGCLIALDRLLDRWRGGAALDLGTGSGILAIALAKEGVAPVAASDNDPVAVDIATENARLNGVADRVAVVLSQGFKNPEIRRRGPYELIVANILAGPLTRMAPALVRYLAPEGTVVLSGLLDEQGDGVAAAYTRLGMEVADHVDRGEWRTLVLRNL